jgi:acyl-CoA thioesterase
MNLEEAKEFFMQDRYAMVTTGITIEAVAEHYAKCSLKLDERHRNATGHVMGGVLFTLADFAFAVSTNTKETVTVTTVSQISYLSPAKGNILYGESKLLKDGKRNCFYEITITDEFGTVAAVVNATGTHLTSK